LCDVRGSNANSSPFTFDELVEAAQLAGILAFSADGIAVLDRRGSRRGPETRRQESADSAPHRTADNLLVKSSAEPIRD